MTEPESLDLVLKVLYQKPDKRGHLLQLLLNEGISLTLDDAYRLGRQLGEAGYVLYEPTQVDVALALTAEGLAFAEHTSFTETGTPISPRDTRLDTLYDTLTDEAGPITIAIDPADFEAARQTLRRIREAIDQDPAADEDTRLAVEDCTKAIGIGIDSGNPFNKYNVLALVELAATTPVIAGSVRAFVHFLR